MTTEIVKMTMMVGIKVVMAVTVMVEMVMVTVILRMLAGCVCLSKTN